MLKHSVNTIFLLGTTCLAATAHAEIAGNIQVSYQSGDWQNPGQDEDFSATNVAGSISYTLENGLSFILNVDFDEPDYPSGFSNSSQGINQESTSLHVLYPVTDTFKVGGFLGLANTDNGSSSTYDYRGKFVGVEAHALISDSMGVFGQFGNYDQRDDEGTDEMGFTNGQFYRLGLYNQYANGSVSKILLERGTSTSYEDSDEPGIIDSVEVSHEIPIKAINNTVFEFGVRSARFEALNDDDEVREQSFFLGWKFNFGGSTFNQYAAGLVGDPYTIKRADKFVSELD